MKLCARRLTVLLSLMLALTPIALADMWASARQTDYLSPSGKYLLKVEPASKREKKETCRATLFRVGQDMEKVWSQNLENKKAPVQVFVPDSARFIVTMDEWHNVGKLPIVIYGKGGRLIKAYSLNTLEISGNPNIERSVSSIWWNKNSISFFGPEDNTFFVRLKWGQWLVFDLASGNIIKVDSNAEPKWSDLLRYRDNTLSQRAISMLTSDSPKERETGAIVSGQEKFKNAIPQLRELLKDNEAFILGDLGGADEKRVYYVRKAAKEALVRMGEQVENIVTEEPLNKNTIANTPNANTSTSNMKSEGVERLSVRIIKVEPASNGNKSLILHVELENIGNTEIKGIIQSASRFIIELDGRYYAKEDYGGKSSYMPPTRKYGPIIVDTSGFIETKENSKFRQPIITSDTPHLFPDVHGTHKIRLYYRYGERGNTIEKSDLKSIDIP